MDELVVRRIEHPGALKISPGYTDMLDMCTGWAVDDAIDEANEDGISHLDVMQQVVTDPDFKHPQLGVRYPAIMPLKLQDGPDAPEPEWLVYADVLLSARPMFTSDPVSAADATAIQLGRFIQLNKLVELARGAPGWLKLVDGKFRFSTEPSAAFLSNPAALVEAWGTRGRLWGMLTKTAEGNRDAAELMNDLTWLMSQPCAKSLVLHLDFFAKPETGEGPEPLVIPELTPIEMEVSPGIWVELFAFQRKAGTDIGRLVTL